MSGSSISPKIEIYDNPTNEHSGMPPIDNSHYYEGFSLIAGEFLLKAHCDKYNIDSKSPDALAKLQDCEFAIALEINPSIEKSLFDNYYQRYLNAQIKFLSDIKLRQENHDDSRENSILFAPSGANLDHNVDALGTTHLLSAVIKEFGIKELTAKVESGPGQESKNSLYWDNVSTPVELAASIIRAGTSTEYRKIRLRATTEVRQWIRKTLENENYDTQECLGSAPAVCSLLAKVLAFNPTMVMQESISKNLKDRLPEELKIFDGSDDITTTNQIKTENVNNDHFPIFFNQGGVNVVLDVPTFKINGADFSINNIKHADLIVTGSNRTSWESFGSANDATIEYLVAHNSLAVFSGFQNLSENQTSQDFISTVSGIHDRGSAVALLYSKSKFPDSEAAIFQEIKKRGCIDYIGMNTDETPYLLKNIALDAAQQNLLQTDPALASLAKELADKSLSPDKIWEVSKESPKWMLETALTLKKILDIPIIRIRGRTSDLIICDKEIESSPESLVDNLVLSRHLAVLKVGFYPQLFYKTEDLTFLQNPPCGMALAAYVALSDAIKDLCDISNEEKQAFLATGFIDTNEYRIISAPTPPMIAFQGRTVSAGDIMDSSFSMLSRDFLCAAQRITV